MLAFDKVFALQALVFLLALPLVLLLRHESSEPEPVEGTLE